MGDLDNFGAFRDQGAYPLNVSFHRSGIRLEDLHHDTAKVMLIVPRIVSTHMRMALQDDLIPSLQAKARRDNGIALTRIARESNLVAAAG